MKEFISQTTVPPLESRQMMSVLPSPFTSAVLLTAQERSPPMSADEMIVPSSINQPITIPGAIPEEEFRHSRSCRPSPLKSPVPARVTWSSTDRTAAEITLVPFIRCSTFAPVVRVQIRSAMPSALES